MTYYWTKTGKYHSDRNSENEDAFIILKENNRQVISLCDGVSSCKYAKVGAEIASKSIAEFYLKNLDKLYKYKRRIIAEITVNHIMYDLKKYATKNNKQVEELSSTLSCISIDMDLDKGLVCNIGDGLIGAVDKNKVVILSEPQIGKRTETTTTKGVEKSTDIVYFNPSEFKGFFICSDGLWKQFYNHCKFDDEIVKLIKDLDFESVTRLLKKESVYDDRSVVAIINKKVKVA